MKLAYVGGRLKIIELVREIQRVLEEHGFVIDYDWTSHGSLRGNPEGLTAIAPKMTKAAGRADVAVYLLANGEESPQAGLHVEMGASLLGGALVFLWTPPEHGYLLDPTNKRCKSFYVHPNVTRCVASEDKVAESVREWLTSSARVSSLDLPAGLE